MRVQELCVEDRDQWDYYVCQSPGGNFHQLSDWKEVMESTFGHELHYLCVKENGRISGVLPLLHINSMIGGHYLTSMPGGLSADDSQSAAALIERAKELVEEHHANYLVLRDSYQKWDYPDLVTDSRHCTMVVKITPDIELVRRNIKKRARQLTNQAIQAGLEVNEGLEHLDSFYPAYAKAMRDKGTPTLGLAFFRSIAEQFPQEFHLLAIRYHQQKLGGGFFANFKDTIYCSWAGMVQEYYDLHPSHLLYWETLKFACENGFQWVDLGRCERESGSYIFKKNWGAEPVPLYQQYYLNGLNQLPSTGHARQEDRFYRIFVSIWSRLPVSWTDRLGPFLRKRMPFG